MFRPLPISRAILTLTFLLIASGSDAQSQTDKSIVNTGIGVGPNHGIIGTKTIIGKNGSGFMLGIGGVKGQLTYTLGGQLCLKWFYTSISYGATTVIKDENNEFVETYSGWNFMGGGRINLDKKKKVFLEIGLGISTGVYSMDIAPVGDIGLGFRLGSVKKKEKVMNL